jgi:hypothetical protein
MLESISVFVLLRIRVQKLIITRPNSYPIIIIFHPNSNGEPESSLFSKIERWR